MATTTERSRATATAAGGNPLLSENFEVPFDRIEPRHIEPGVREVLARGQKRIDELKSLAEPPTWDNFMGPLDDATRWVYERLSPAGHLMSVAETKELREAYNAVLPDISAFWTRLPLDQQLWKRVKAYAESAEAKSLEGIRARHLRKSLLEFRRAGADLPADRRERLEAVKVELAQVQQKFSENVLDATAAYELVITDESRLGGVPDSPKQRFAAAAKEAGKEGWLITLDFPAIEPILKYCQDRELRREVHVAYTTRCRDGQFDNRSLVLKILSLRHEQATLLGYGDFADYRLEDHMVKSGLRAVEFEQDLMDRTRPYWQRDYEALLAHAKEIGLDTLRPWDSVFVGESLRRKEYELDDEMLRPYFPLESVMDGLFEIVGRAFGVTVRPAAGGHPWDAEVRYYDVTDVDGVWLGAFYADWFPRKEKRQGAWMNDLLTGGPRDDGGFDPHLGAICGNFAPPEAGSNGSGPAPALLTHRDVETIFHEFGHLLHHSTSRVPVRSRSGLNVAWDWVELPSQIMENWAWERAALDLFAHHYKTGETIPDSIFQRMTAAKRFLGGWAQMRQLSFGTVDLELHRELAPRAHEMTEDEVMAFAKERFRRFVPTDEFAEYHVLTSFTHLFAGGYAAGYYSYLWSEVLDADVFTLFREHGIFDRTTGRRYMDTILTRGDSADPEDLFRELMGRDPDPSALLERNLGVPPTPIAGDAVPAV